MAKTKRNIEIAVIAVTLPRGLNSLPVGFKKTFAAKCKELNYTMKTQLAEYASKSGSIAGKTGTVARGRKGKG